MFQHRELKPEIENKISCYSPVQQNTSSLWSINEPFYIHLLQGSRVNADEGMKVGVVSVLGFFPLRCCSMERAARSLVYPVPPFQLYAALTCK